MTTIHFGFTIFCIHSVRSVFLPRGALNMKCHQVRWQGFPRSLRREEGSPPSSASAQANVNSAKTRRTPKGSPIKTASSLITHRESVRHTQALGNHLIISGRMEQDFLVQPEKKRLLTNFSSACSPDDWWWFSFAISASPCVYIIADLVSFWGRPQMYAVALPILMTRLIPTHGPGVRE